MILDDKISETEVINGKIVMRHGMVLACLPHYREVKMAMNDGSFHVAPMCEPCSADLTLDKVRLAAKVDPEPVGDRHPTLAMHADLIIRE